jgi:hypothetical protein
MIQPDNFRDDPYGHATNQIGHAFAVGCLGLVYGVVLACWYFGGEFPPKWSIIAGAAVFYAAFEWITQGWNGWDTVEDWVFVVIHGTAAPVMIFSEVEPGSTKFQGDLLVALPFVVLFLLHLAAGAFFRR